MRLLGGFVWVLSGTRLDKILDAGIEAGRLRGITEERNRLIADNPDSTYEEACAALAMADQAMAASDHLQEVIGKH